MRSFASDNNSGVHPAVLEAMAEANQGHAPAYGQDLWTLAADEAFAREFGPRAEAYFVFGGTGANVSGLASFCRRWDAVICADCAHINIDECAAPEKVGGVKLITIPNTDGKIGPEGIKKHLHGFGFEHHAQPRAVSITQSTEYGTIYSPEEIRAIADLAHEYGLLLHMDGARIANAATALGCSLNDTSGACGVDVLSFGGTKNGLMFGEAVVFFKPELARDFKYVRKQTTQLYSKMRYISAQFTAYLKDDLWRTNAEHANAMARLLAEQAGGIDGVEITRPVTVNAVFARIDPKAVPLLRKRYPFYVWDESNGELRWMTSFDTRKEDVLGFVSAMRDALAGKG